MGVAAMAASMMHNNSSTDTRDPEDLRVPGGVGGGNPFLGRGGPLGGIPPPGAAGPHMGSALLDTYLSMIAAAGGDSNSMAAALGAFPGRAAAFAQAASQLSASGAQQKTENTPQVFLGLNNGKDITDEGRSASEDREDEALASDADISDTEDNTSEIKQVANPNDEDSIAAEDN